MFHPVRDGSRPRYAVEHVRADAIPVALVHNAGDPAKRFEASYLDPGVERVFDRLLEEQRPDLVHFTYLLWGLSLRLPELAHARGLATVVTLTDYGLLCHRGQMFDASLARCGGPHGPEVCARCIRTSSRFDGTPLKRVLHDAAAHSAAFLGGFGRVPTARTVGLRAARVARLFDTVAAFVAPTHGLAEAFRRAGLSSDKLTELVYAFDETPYASARALPAAAPPRFGFLAQFAPHKGLATLLEAARLLHQEAPARPWELHLYGQGSSARHRLYAPALLADPGPRVRLREPFEPERAPEVLAQLAALVLPSEWDENAPLSVLQARSLGLPVLGSDVPGITEVLDPSSSGVYPVGDAPALARRMGEVLEGRIARSANPGLPLSLQEHLDKIEDLYARIRASAG